MQENNDLLILAVVGMPATGKSEVLKTLVKEYDFYHLYYGGITIDEVKRRGLEVNEENERSVREEMRKSGDIGIYSRFMIPKIEEAIFQGHKKIILESMYNVQEYEIIKEKYGNAFKVLAIHSDRQIRIKRLNERKERPLTEKELTSREVSEAKKLWKGTLIAMADYHLINNSNSMKSFENSLNIFLTRTLNLERNTKNYLKNYKDWGQLKESVNFEATISEPGVKEVFFSEREIWYCSVGVNIGSEQDGQNELFERPVLIFKKFNQNMFYGFPLTSKLKIGKYYLKLSVQGVDSSVILSQMRLFDSKRLQRKIRTMDKFEFLEIKDKFKSLF